MTISSFRFREALKVNFCCISYLYLLRLGRECSSSSFFLSPSTTMLRAHTILTRSSFSLLSLLISLRYDISDRHVLSTSFESHLYTVTSETLNSFAVSDTDLQSCFTCLSIVSFTSFGITRKFDDIYCYQLNNNDYIDD